MNRTIHDIIPSAVICGMAFFSSCVCARAQSSLSPYTMYGIGAFDTGNHGAGSGMAGLGIGLRESNTLNSANPAALTAIDEKTFVLDMAVTGSFNNLSGQTRNAVSGTGNIDRIALGFRAGSFVTLSAGVNPVASVAYNIRKSSFIEGSSETFDSYYTGSGGLHKVYLSLGFDVFRDLSVGITGSLVMGQITYTESSDWWTAEMKSVSDVTPYMDFGIQYHRSIGNGRTVTAGITGGYRQDFSMHNTVNIVDNADSSVVSDNTKASVTRSIPAYAGAGISYSSRKFTVGIDYSFQQYSAIDSGSDVIRFKDRNRITVGLSYVPGKYDVRRYWKRIKFMAGASVDDSYIVASGSPGLNWGVSAGMSFPLRNATSFYWSLNFNRYSFPAVNRNTISESSLGLTFGISFGESWFVRKRLE